MDEDGFGYIAKNQVVSGPMHRTPPTPPTLVGTVHAARITGGNWRKNKQRSGKRRRKEQTRPHDAESRRALAKAIDRDIASGVLNWQAPVEYSSAMKMTMVDRQTLPNDPKRLVLTTLRACALNSTVRLPRLKLRQNTIPRSYSVLPASAIHNGALLITVGDFYWAVMSPREQEDYLRVNTTS